MPHVLEDVACEDLLVGDDCGAIYYYAVHWPEFAAGQVILLTKLDAHSQNICGLAWSPDGQTFVSGGNDNSALLFEMSDVLNKDAAVRAICSTTPTVQAGDTAADSFDAYGSTITDLLQSALQAGIRPYIQGEHLNLDSWTMAGAMNPSNEPLTPPDTPLNEQSRGRSSLRTERNTLPTPPRLFNPLRGSSPTPPGLFSPERRASNMENSLASPGIIGRRSVHKRTFHHAAAVKAIAYAPWQPTLLATGGGSNDRQIHFHHTESGTVLAVINVDAQVTSLCWSSTKREIAATFGYAQPEHNVRIAVFAWPSCECVVSIPWERKANGEIGRALWAILYPGGPNDVPSVRHEEADSTLQRPQASLSQSRLFEMSRMLEATSGQGTSTENDTSNAQTQEPATGDSSRSSRFTTRQNLARSEGEAWASRTEEEGSLIIACCDQTVKFFEVWAGKSKGRTLGVGAKAGVLGGSKILEGWCTEVSVDEVEETNSIR